MFTLVDHVHLSSMRALVRCPVGGRGQSSMIENSGSALQVSHPPGKLLTVQQENKNDELSKSAHELLSAIGNAT